MKSHEEQFYLFVDITDKKSEINRLIIDKI